MLPVPFFHGRLHLVILFLPGEFLVGEVHVVHVMFAGIVADLQPGIAAEQLLQFVLHGEDTADDDRRAGVYPHRAAEDGGETLVHPPCPVHVGSEPCAVLCQRLLPIAHSVRLDVRLVDDVQPVLVAELVPVRVIDIMRAAHEVDVVLFHQADVLLHEFLAHGAPAL